MIRRMTCPICEKELPKEIDSHASLFPFCSQRCKQVDLYKWFSGDYSIVEELTPEKLFEKSLQEDFPAEEIP